MRNMIPANKKWRFFLAEPFFLASFILPEISDFVIIPYFIKSAQ